MEFVCLMIVALTKNMPYVLQSIPKQNLNGDCLERAILYNIKALQEYDFMLKALFMIIDNHMPAKFLLTASCCDQIREQFLTCLFQITINRSTYIFFDTVHLIKNLRNNCLIGRYLSSGLYINSEALPDPFQLIEKFHGVYCFNFKRKRRNVKKISVLRRI